MIDIKKYFLILGMFSIFSQSLFCSVKTENINPINQKKCGLSEESAIPEKPSENIKDWNFLVYMAANNNLYKFAEQNLLQMIKVGSNKNINILVQLDVLGENEVTRFYVKKNDSIAVEIKENSLEGISGTPENLFDFAKWAITNYPAKHQALILWNHGSGIEDPHIWGKVYSHKPNSAYLLNSKTGLLGFNKDYIQTNLSTFLNTPGKRGIAFNDNFETYLTNQDLKNTLNKICVELLNGKKIDIVGMDACNMGMTEVASQIKDSAKYMVGSEEVEPGSGWQYIYVLSQFKSLFKSLFRSSLSPLKFANHIVDSYKLEYNDILSEYTQSAVDLNKMDLLEKNIDEVSDLLVEIIEEEQSTFAEIKKIRRSKYMTTEFGNTNYVDLFHFYKSLKEKIQKLKKKSSIKELAIQLEAKLLEGLELKNSIITRNVAGSNYPEANGLSIYFPKYDIHDSYDKTSFGKTNKWKDFLELFTVLY